MNKKKTVGIVICIVALLVVGVILIKGIKKSSAATTGFFNICNPIKEAQHEKGNSGMEGMAAGPKLMFVSLPKVFASMGAVGPFIGIAFFIMAGFAALTSCISVLEAITANCMEIFRARRETVTRVLGLAYTVISVVIALGYSVFYIEVGLPNGTTGQLLDIMDYISNSCMMPVISLCSAILIGWVVKPDWVIEEMERDGSVMPRKWLYRFIIRYVAPVIMLILCLQAFGILL